MSFLLGLPIFWGYVKFQGCIYCTLEFAWWLVPNEPLLARNSRPYLRVYEPVSLNKAFLKPWGGCVKGEGVGWLANIAQDANGKGGPKVFSQMVVKNANESPGAIRKSLKVEGAHNQLW